MPTQPVRERVGVIPAGQVKRDELRGGGAPRWARAARLAVVAAALIAAPLVAPFLTAPVAAQEGCRLPSDEQLDAGGALEGIILGLHGLVFEPVPLEQGVAFGDPGSCPGGSRDAFRGVDIMGWVLEVSGPAQPDLCSPDDPPVLELPLTTTRCVQPSTAIASRNARVPFPELLTRAPFLLLLPSTLPHDLAPHWATLRVTDRRATSGVPRQYGTVLRYLGAEAEPWLLLLEDTGQAGGWLLDSLRANAPTLPLRGTQATVLTALPPYEGPGSGLLWEEAGLRLVLFGTYSPDELATIATGLSLQPARAAGNPSFP